MNKYKRPLAVNSKIVELLTKMRLNSIWLWSIIECTLDIVFLRKLVTSLQVATNKHHSNIIVRTRLFHVRFKVRFPPII